MIRLDVRNTKRMLSIHGWVSVCLGLILYVLFCTGTVSVFAVELRDWGNSWQGGSTSAERHDWDDRVRKILLTIPEQFWETISIERDAGNTLSVYAYRAETDPEDVNGLGLIRGVKVYAAADGTIVARYQGLDDEIEEVDSQSALGQFFVSLHTRLHVPDPWGSLLTGLAGAALLVLTVSGFLIHRRYFKEMFVIKKQHPKLRMRELHVVAGSWLLPFAFLVAVSGCYLSFVSSIGLPLMARVLTSGNQSELSQALSPSQFQPNAAKAPVANLDQMITRARELSGTTISLLKIVGWGRADAQVEVRSKLSPGSIVDHGVLFDAPTGHVVEAKMGLDNLYSAGSMTNQLLVQLHYGRFSGLVSQIFWASMGFGLAYMTLTGMLLWTRRREDLGGWHWLLKLTEFVGYGLPFVLCVIGHAYFGAREFGLPAHRIMMEALGIGTLAVGTICFASSAPRPIVVAATGVALMLLPLSRTLVFGFEWSNWLHASRYSLIALDLTMAIAGMVCFRIASSRKYLFLRQSSFASEKTADAAS